MHISHSYSLLKIFNIYVHIFHLFHSYHFWEQTSWLNLFDYIFYYGFYYMSIIVIFFRFLNIQIMENYDRKLL